MKKNLQHSLYSYAIKRGQKGLKNSLSIILGCSLLFASAMSFASDKEKEKRWASQVTDALMDGEAVYLNDGKDDFLALDMPAEEKSDIGIVVMHGIGIHPDWPQVVNPLRVGLSEAGWHTISLQMPVLENGAKGEDYLPLMTEVGPRIEAAIKHLQKAGAKKIILVSHSLGAQMTSNYLANRPEPKAEDQEAAPIIAYVAIGMGESNAELLSKIKLPVFDIYGSEDLDGVVKSAPDRAKASAENKSYQQEKVAGANHFFDDKSEELVEIVEKYISGLSK